MPTETAAAAAAFSLPGDIENQEKSVAQSANRICGFGDNCLSRREARAREAESMHYPIWTLDPSWLVLVEIISFNIQLEISSHRHHRFLAF